MTITPDISMGNILTILVAIAVPTIAFLVSLAILRTTVALEKNRTDEKFTEVNARVGNIEAEIKGDKARQESGIARVQDSLVSLGSVLHEVQTKVAVLFDRDDRQAQPAPPSNQQPRARVGRNPTS